MEQLAPMVRQQVRHIQGAFARGGPGDPPVDIAIVPEGQGVGYMYAADQLLVTDEHLEAVLTLLGQPQDKAEAIRQQRIERVIGDIVLLHLTTATTTTHHVKGGEQPDVVAALAAIDALIGEGVAAPNYVLTVAPVVTPCPATEPEEVYEGIEPYPGICTGNNGAGVLIYVADTGLLEHADTNFPWLHGARRAVDANGAVQGWDRIGPVTNGLPLIYPYTGHGTFVAGVARCLAPRSDVIVSNIFKNAGSALESDFVQDLARALGQGVDIFHLSIASSTRFSQPMLAFGRWLSALRQYKGVVCVVAAGNWGVRQPAWPAAFSQVVSVGALSADWRDRASFSNHGGWVDVYAPGRNLINAFATGYYVCHHEPYVNEERKFYGMAQWSGTSFSTPIVTGLIADRMSRTGENGQEAARALLRDARSQAIPGVGAVLLPPGGADPGRHQRS
jgi:subtilisin family serine protease